MVEILKHSVAHNCSISAQVPAVLHRYSCITVYTDHIISLQLSQELQSISLHVDAVHTLSYTDEHGELVNPLLNIDNAAAQLLERADKCMKRFGEAIVLYDS